MGDGKNRKIGEGFVGRERVGEKDNGKGGWGWGKWGEGEKRVEGKGKENVAKGMRVRNGLNPRAFRIGIGIGVREDAGMMYERLKDGFVSLLFLPFPRPILLHSLRPTLLPSPLHSPPLRFTPSSLPFRFTPPSSSLPSLFLSHLPSLSSNHLEQKKKTILTYSIR